MVSLVLLYVTTIGTLSKCQYHFLPFARYFSQDWLIIVCPDSKYFPKCCWAQSTTSEPASFVVVPKAQATFWKSNFSGGHPPIAFSHFWTKITFFPPLGQEILPAELPVSKCRYAGPPIFHQTLNIICIHLLTL